jgi:hypothetical protein
MNVVALILRTLIRGGVYRALGRARFGWVGIVVVVVVASVLLFVADRAGAATYLNGCPPFGAPVTDTQMQCAALAERLEVLVAQGEAPSPAVLAGDSQLALEDVRHGIAWACGILLFGLVILPLLVRVFHRGEGRV